MIERIEYEFVCRQPSCGENGKPKPITKHVVAGVIERPTSLLCPSCGMELWLAKTETVRTGASHG